MRTRAREREKERKRVCACVFCARIRLTHARLPAIARRLDGTRQIQSIYQSFGSLLVPPTLGYALQNRGTLFDVKDARHPNVYAPRKRPFHTIIPGFATEVVQANASAQERPMLAFGVMGGNMQPQVRSHWAPPMARACAHRRPRARR